MCAIFEKSRKIYREIFDKILLDRHFKLNFLCAYCVHIWHILIIMPSPGEFKDQSRGACGHIMAAFDLHEHCAHCRDKKIGQDPCLKDSPCSISDNFSDLQRETLSTPSYRIHKDRKAGLLLSPKEVTVISTVEELSSDTTPADNSTAQAALVLQPSA